MPATTEPEHSLAAYLLAVEQGADAIECDVRLTADGTLVCVHDRRIDRTSTGRGPVSAKTLSQLAAYDYSRPGDVWRDFEDPAPDESRTAVLTLQTLLATMLDASDDGAVRDRDEAPDAVRRLRRGQPGGPAALVRPDAADRRRDPTRARDVLQPDGRPPGRRARAGTPTVLLMDDVPRRYRDGSLPEGVSISGPSIDVLRAHPHYVDRVHARGGRVHVWTVDEPADVDLCVGLGVDAIITNRPGRVLEMLGR